MAHTRYMLDKQGYMHARACTRPCTHTHTHAHNAHACMHPRAHTHKCVILIAFPRQQRLCKLTSMLRYTYILSVIPYLCIYTKPDGPFGPKHVTRR